MKKYLPTTSVERGSRHPCGGLQALVFKVHAKLGHLPVKLRHSLRDASSVPIWTKATADQVAACQIAPRARCVPRYQQLSGFSVQIDEAAVLLDENQAARDVLK